MSELQRDLTRISHNTKIVATLGPGSNNVQLLEDMIRVGGLNVVRFNFSHGTPEFHEENARIVREAAKRAGQEIAILADLQGPKIRVGKIAGGSIELNKGETLVLDAALEGEGTREAVGLDYRDLPNDVAAGDVLWLDDGLLTLTVEAVEGSKIITRVENSHVLKSNKGINKRGGGLSAGALTEKDFRDLKTAIAIGCDYLAISFVKSAEDLHIARAKVEEEMKGSTAVRPGLVSKIERVEAIENLDEIILASDGIMVARGDLGVEMPLEAVPLVQKRAIELARIAAKPVIVATQVMDSMIKNPRPTRAEASDCANAILDGADAVMLSGETSVGAFPIETVRTMAAIIESTEENGGERIASIPSFFADRAGVICEAAARIAEHMDARYLVTFTQSGTSARLLSRMRRPIPMLAFTPLESTRRRLALSWGIQSYRVPEVRHTDDMVWQLDQVVQSAHLAEIGEQLVIVAGMPPGIPRFFEHAAYPRGG